MSDEPDTNAEGTPSYGGDLVGPGTGDTPTGDPDAANDPDVQALLENLRSDADEGNVAVPYDEAAEDVGTGTDR
jgi:hypothetical protein